MVCHPVEAFTKGRKQLLSYYITIKFKLFCIWIVLVLWVWVDGA